MTEAPPKRRLAAILAADVVGFSKLMGKDEVGTLAALKRLRIELVDPNISAYKGRVFKTTGDGFLVEFPSVVNAVACAVDIQKGMALLNGNVPGARAIQFRIGVNIGDVIIEDEDVFGDGVNVAARLESKSPAGAVAVSLAVRDQIGNRLDVLFEDLGELSLKNIERPVRVYTVRPGTMEFARPPRLDLPEKSALASDVTLISALAELQPRTARAGAVRLAKCSLAVLPLQTTGDNPEQESLALGISEDLITELARYQHLAVVSRSSSFSQSIISQTPSDSGRELGADFVLAGSLRSSGGRLRISVQLTDSATGVHVWTERYDRSFADVFAVQDEIVDSVLAGISIHLKLAATSRLQRKSTTTPSAYGAFLLARAAYHSGDDVIARKHIYEAIEIDPHYARAVAYLAFLYGESRFHGSCDLSDSELVAKVDDYCRKAISLDATDATVLSLTGYAYYLIGEITSAIRLIDAAIELQPRDVVIHLHRCQILAYSGRAGEGLELIKRIFKVERHLFPGLRSCLSEIYFLARNYEAALEVLSPIFNAPLPILMIRAAALGHLGKTVEANIAIEQVAAKAPKAFDVIHLARVWASLCKLPSDSENWIEGFRKAGLAI